eukprot:gene11817-8128_t
MHQVTDCGSSESPFLSLSPRSRCLCIRRMLRHMEHPYAGERGMRASAAHLAERLLLLSSGLPTSRLHGVRVVR